MRPMFNLKELNQFLYWEHFKMENIQMIRYLIQEGDWIVKMELKDAYCALLIRQKDWKWLRLQWKEETYEFICLLFGVSAAPRVFTKNSQTSCGLDETVWVLDDNMHRQQFATSVI